MAAAPSHRLFFALWPDAGLRGRLAAAAAPVIQRLGGWAVPPEDLHLTLAFLGQVADERLPALMAAAVRVHAAPFTLRLASLEYWRDSQVLCAVVQEAAAVQTQVQGLAAALWEAGVSSGAIGRGAITGARALRPHVTLARRLVSDGPPAADARRICLLPSAMEFPARNFVLAQSRSQSRARAMAAPAADTGDLTGCYHRLAMWPLA